MGWKHESSCVCTYKREYEYCTVQYKLGSHELSRVEVNVQMEVNVPYSVPCLALVEVRGNGSLRRRGCFLGLRAPVFVGQPPEVPPGAVGKKERLEMADERGLTSPTR